MSRSSRRKFLTSAAALAAASSCSTPVKSSLAPPPRVSGTQGKLELDRFIEDVKQSGFVADALKRSNQPDAQVAPAEK